MVGPLEVPTTRVQECPLLHTHQHLVWWLFLGFSIPSRALVQATFEEILCLEDT